MKRLTFRADEDLIGRARAQAEHTPVSKQFQLWLEAYIQEGRGQLDKMLDDTRYKAGK